MEDFTKNKKRTIEKTKFKSLDKMLLDQENETKKQKMIDKNSLRNRKKSMRGRI